MESVEKFSPFPKPKEALEFCKKHLQSQRKSGLTRKKYCQINNISYVRFSYWARKISKNKTSSDSQESPLIAVKVKASTFASKETEVIGSLNLSNGRLLKIHRLDVLAYIIERMS